MDHPERIGRYQIFGEVGAGGFATVYRAHDPVLDREIAVKVLHPFHARNPELRARFVREGRALARVRHPDLVQVFDAGEADGYTYLAMEFVPGRSLEELARGRQMTLAELLPIVRQVAGALDAVHAAGLVHRDVKPANIRVTDDGRAVLLDLGVAHDTAATQATGTGMIVGTPGFLAPEQIDGSHPVTRRTDVYQLGATVFSLLAGKPPFSGETAQVLFSVVSRPPDDLGTLRPDVPLPVQGAVAQAMAKLPDFRPATAGAFAAALAGDAAPPPPVTAHPVPTPAPPPARETETATTASQTSTIVDVSSVAAPPAALTARAATAAKPRWLLSALAALALLLVAGAGAWLLIGRGDGSAADATATTAAGGEGSGTAVPETGAITPGGRPVPVSLSAANRKLELPFQGKAGQRVSLRLSSVTSGVYITFRRPDGGNVGDRPYVGPPEGFLEPRTLPVAGTYTLVVEADPPQSASLTLTLIDVPPDVTASIRPDGVPVTVTTSAPGQNAALSFDGRAGQRVSLRLTRLEDGLYVSIHRPDGTLLGGRGYVGPGEGFVEPVDLPAPGRYQIRVDPEGEETATATLTLYDVPDDITVNATPGGPPQLVTFSSPGRNAAIRVDGKAGQRISARLTRMSVSIYLTVLKPDGSKLGSPTYLSPPEAFVDTVTLPVAGVYEILLDPERDDTGNLTVSLFDVPPDATAAVTVGGGPATLSIGTPGQAARVTFSGSAGQRLSVRLTRLTVAVAVSVQAPDGATVQSQTYVSPREGTVELKPLPATGAYEILLDPERGDTGDLTVTVVTAAAP